MTGAKNCKWQIIIPTVVDRPLLFERLRDTLAPQVAKYNGDIEVLVCWNNYETELSRLRQKLIEETTAEYTNFIDDDDNVSEDYCDSIYPLLDGVDYIGFKVDFPQGGSNRPVIHSLSCEKWEETPHGFYRRGTLINPTRRELMLKAGFKNADYHKNIPEDITYARNVDKLLKTEHFIDKEVHIYLPTDHHAWQIFDPRTDIKLKRPKLPKYFRFSKHSTNES